MMKINKFKTSGLIILMIVLLLVGCSGNETSNLHINDNKHQVANEMDEVISNYIIQKYTSTKVYPSTEKLFEVHKIYGTSESDGVISVYMYSYFGGFNKSTGLESQMGHSLPALIRLQKKETGYTVVDYTEPKDGNLYVSSLEKMFPEKYLNIAQRDVGNIDDLEQLMDNRVQQWLDGELNE